ncbi:MAG: TRZ/ATZ family hydrolase [Gammaproteobacteria bacterium]|nr:TRZ/ATZ family hydrolase [Gammaproteobacteria bacterium]
MPQAVNTIINARWIIPVSDQDKTDYLYQHSLVIQQGRIEAVLPTETVSGQYTAEETIELTEHALMPGMINTHTHASMSLFRGLADDLPLMDWLNNHIWPAEAKWVNEEFVRDGTRLAIAEMIKSGTTCFNDMYFFPDITAQVSASSNIRATVGMIVIDFPSNWAADQNDYFNKGLQVHDQYKDHPLIKAAFAPHAPYSVSDEPLQRIQMLANELDVAIHMHVHETVDEINMGIENHHCRPIERLNRLGLLSPSLMAVHMTQLTEDEIQLISDTGTQVVHCPQSNLKLASGFCPVQKLVENNINVALGSDSAASNNNLDMLNEMQTAALLAKGVSGNAEAVPALQALKMATINGAKALGIDSETGSLEAGKSADITAIDMNRSGTEPVYNPISQIVYASQSADVSDVWIAGKQVLKNRQLTLMDEKDIIEKARNWQTRILTG